MSKKFSKNELKKMNKSVAAGSATNPSINGQQYRKNATKMSVCSDAEPKSLHMEFKTQKTIASPSTRTKEPFCKNHNN